jgi:hypothetical protein
VIWLCKGNSRYLRGPGKMAQGVYLSIAIRRAPLYTSSQAREAELPHRTSSKFLNTPEGGSFYGPGSTPSRRR